MPITENFDKSISGLIILSSVIEYCDLRSNHQESSLNSWYLIHGCMKKAFEDEEENLIENVTTSQNV